MANDIGCILKGIRDTEVTDTFFFIHWHRVPQDSKVTYILIVCDITTMKNVLASDMEAELGLLFVKCQRGASLRFSLEEMVHQQTPTPVVTDSATCNLFVNENTRQRRSRAIDMIFYWVHDIVRRGHY